MLTFPNLQSCWGFCSVEKGAYYMSLINMMFGLYILMLGCNNSNDGAHILKYSGILVILQGLLLLYGIETKKTSLLFAWMIMYVLEVGLSCSVLLFFTFLIAIFDISIAVVMLVIGGGMLISISFYTMAIVSTCRKNIMRNSNIPLFDPRDNITHPVWGPDLKHRTT